MSTTESSNPLNIEEIILSQLYRNDEYIRKVLPYIDKSYFMDKEHLVLFGLIKKYFEKYNKLPTFETLQYGVQNAKSLGENVHKETLGLLNKIKDVGTQDTQWLLDSTEEFCQNRALFNALIQSVNIAEGEEKNISKTAIPDILSKALQVSFDTNLGHKYFEDAEKRYDYYTAPKSKIKTHLEWLNTITNGGLDLSTLTCFMSPTHGGKSAIMIDMAANQVRFGQKVLYISMEMSEEQVGKRIDANILDVDLNKVDKMGKNVYLTNIDTQAKKYGVDLIVREYPSNSAHVGHFKTLLAELKQKENFVPTIIFIDYLNICASSTLPVSAKQNSYLYVKTIAEEIRAMAQELKLPIITATQANRGGYGNSDMTMTDTSESMGLPHTLDLFIGLMRSEELDQMGQVKMKQLKNRMGDVGYKNTTCLGFESMRQRFYDLQNQTGQNGLTGQNGTNTAPQNGSGSGNFGKINRGKSNLNFNGVKS